MKCLNSSTPDGNKGAKTEKPVEKKTTAKKTTKK